MPSLQERLAAISPLLAESAAKYRVPGAALAVLLGDETAEFATGVVNARTGVETTNDAVFQIGSITKVFTTTLIMQLVEEGRIDLDAPVKRYLPELQFLDPVATETVTVRHLLTHTSGIDGDFFLDTGRGDDCVERYVLACAALPQLHAPGAGWSYCNAGFVIAGRIIEKLTGLTWDAALHQRLLRPVGAKTMATLPEEAILFRAAAGHIPGPGGEFGVAPLWMLPRSNGPAGATPFAAARDLLAFARMHIDGGLGLDGERVLSEASVRAMQEKHVEIASVEDRDGWGLGWMRFTWPGGRVVGHDGGTIGQASYFRIAPEKALAVALLTNGGNGQALYRKVFSGLFSDLAGITMPPLPEPTPGFAIDSTRYAGAFQKLSARAEVDAVEGGGLKVTFLPLKVLVPGQPPQVLMLQPIDERFFVAKPPGGGVKSVVRFDFGPEGRVEYLFAGRLHRRV